MSIKQKIETAVSDLNVLKKQYIEKGTELFHSLMKEIFTLYPAVETIQWTQYTPYWCDGDPCEFGVNEATINDTEKYQIKRILEKVQRATPEAREELVSQIETLRAEEKTCIEQKKYSKAQEALGKIAKIEADLAEMDTPIENFQQIIDAYEDVRMLFEKFDGEIFESLFGDHMRVTVTKDGITTEEYDHE